MKEPACPPSFRPCGALVQEPGREAVRVRVLEALRAWVERFTGLGGL